MFWNMSISFLSLHFGLSITLAEINLGSRTLAHICITDDQWFRVFLRTGNTNAKAKGINKDRQRSGDQKTRLKQAKQRTK